MSEKTIAVIIVSVIVSAIVGIIQIAVVTHCARKTAKKISREAVEKLCQRSGS